MKQQDMAVYSLKKLTPMETSRSIAAEFNCGCDDGSNCICW